MATIGYVIVILGALSVSVNLMHLIDRLSGRAAISAAATQPDSCTFSKS